MTLVWQMMVLGTPLHGACFMGRLPLITALLEHGANPLVRVASNSPSCAGMTAYEVIVNKHGNTHLPAVVARTFRAAGHGDDALHVAPRHRRAVMSVVGVTPPQVMPSQ